ncbi:ECI2 isomerase, partial [Prunella fulvescens]|nr:ECI2 isomerase [Prunella fulvescens]
RPTQAVCIPAIHHLHMTAATMQVSQKDFQKAQEQLKLLKKDPGNEMKLKLYALFKQATEGPCNAPKPGMLDFVKKAKWDAWNSLGNLSQDDARQKYAELVSSLVSAESASQKKEVSPEEGRHDGYETLIVTTKNNITKIMFNRPDRKNAINHQVKQCVSYILHLLFSLLSRELVGHFIDFPKPLIAVVNGPAIGICVTVLGLCDVVYASDRVSTLHGLSQDSLKASSCIKY